jgi:hypothetical protein
VPRLAVLSCDRPLNTVGKPCSQSCTGWCSHLLTDSRARASGFRLVRVVRTWKCNQPLDKGDVVSVWHHYPSPPPPSLTFCHHSLTCSLTHLFTHSLTRPLTHHQPTHPLTHSPTHPLTNAPTHSLTKGPDFTASTGSFFVSQEPSTVMMRSRSSSSSWADTIIFEDASSSAEFDKMFHGLPSARDRADSVAVVPDEPNRSFVAQLCCDDDHLFFPCKGRVYAYSLAKNRVVARLGSGVGGGSVVTDDDDDGGRTRRQIGVCVGGGLIIVHWGSRLVLCDRHNFDNHSFRVLQQYSLGDAEIRRVSLIASQVVLCVMVPTTVRVDTHVSDENGNDNGGYAAVGANGSISSNFVRALAAEIRILTPGESDLDARVTLPASAGPVVAAPYSQAQVSTSLDSYRVAATHTFLACPRRLYILRVATAPERVRWLVKQHQYPLAMHLCQQKYRREQVFMEVAGMHADYLWRRGRHVEAVRIWGEVHLPSAPARCVGTFKQTLLNVLFLLVAVRVCGMPMCLISSMKVDG